MHMMSALPTKSLNYEGLTIRNRRVQRPGRRLTCNYSTIHTIALVYGVRPDMNSAPEVAATRNKSRLLARLSWVCDFQAHGIG